MTLLKNINMQILHPCATKNSLPKLNLLTVRVRNHVSIACHTMILYISNKMIGKVRMILSFFYKCIHIPPPHSQHLQQ